MERGIDACGEGKDLLTARSSGGNLGEARLKLQEVANETGGTSFLL